MIRRSESRKSGMMTLVILILLAFSTVISAQELREMQYEEIPTRVIPDGSYEGKSVLVVETTLSKLSFESTRGINPGSVVEKEPGTWWVTMKPGVQLISIGADGFLPLKEIRHNFANRQAWAIKVTAKMDIIDELPVKIRVEPSGASIRIDGKTVDISGNVELSIAEHTVEITKSGFVTIKEQFTVNKDNIYFEYTLEKPKLSGVEIKTDPPGAKVSINGVEMLGTTPISDFFTSGRFPIHITKEKYLDVEETINIDPSKSENVFSYRLESNTGTIVISSDPEKNLAVTLNGKSVGNTPVTLTEQDVGDYSVSGSHEYYTCESINFTLQRGATYRAVLKAEENFAILTVNTTVGASVYLNNSEIKELRDIRMRPQTVRLRAEKPKCKTVETNLILERGARETVDLYLDEQVGTIAISVEPADAQIDLSGNAGEHFSSEGKNIFENIPIGSYELEVSSKGFKTDKRTLRLRADETLRERIALEEGGGGEGPLPGMVFVEIPGGSFQMGSSSDEKDRGNDEEQHRVTVSSFEMMTTEVTVDQFGQFVNSTGYKTEAEKGDGSYVYEGTWLKKADANWKNPYFTQSNSNPVTCVSWNDIQEFIKWLNQRDPGKNYRLPTEAEWEYACRAGTTTRFYSGNSDSDLDRVGWYTSNSVSKTYPVGQKQPNAWGLYDMHGNVWEWCSDWYGAYPSGSVTDPRGPSSGSLRVIRGGSWYCSAGYCRSAYRDGNDPSARGRNQGFRLLRSL